MTDSTIKAINMLHLILAFSFGIVVGAAGAGYVVREVYGTTHVSVFNINSIKTQKSQEG